MVRGWLNRQETIGLANIPDQLIKLLVWAVLGAAIGGAVMWMVGYAIQRWRVGRNQRGENNGDGTERHSVES
jgi:membrane protein YqaA with SNARE-associated domain